MSLFIVPGDQLVTPDGAENGKHIQNAINKWHSKTYRKVINTIDDAIDDVVKHKATFVWMNTGSLVGYGSTSSHERMVHLWNAISSLTSYEYDPVAEKLVRVTAGSIIKWRVSLRPEEHWLVTYRATGKKDVVSGNEIHASEYWINPDYLPKRRHPKYTLAHLRQKFPPVSLGPFN